MFSILGLLAAVGLETGPDDEAKRDTSLSDVYSTTTGQTNHRRLCHADYSDCIRTVMRNIHAFDPGSA